MYIFLHNFTNIFFSQVNRYVVIFEYRSYLERKYKIEKKSEIRSNHAAEEGKVDC